jgi:hypothetical protein
MKASGTFKSVTFNPLELPAEPTVETNLPVGLVVMEKRYEGEAQGRSATWFVSAYSQATNVGTYVALESFEGSLNGTSGAFNFVHSGTVSGSDRSEEFFTIVPTSGTGDLAGIRGTGGLAIDADGTHRAWFEYELD